MYRDYFGLKELPFSIAPDPRYLYMSERHKEALAHLLYGVSGQGGFVVLTGEVGTGKTTVCRCFLEQVPENTDVAFIVNPKLSARELLANICDEFGIEYPNNASIKVYNDLISHYLLQSHSEGRHTVLIIDEAQNLKIDVLEQLRLLTNLETSEKKLLQIILLGQPELQVMLAQQELRQLAQRITARYHLKALNKEEVTAYISYRLAVAGQKQGLFKAAAIKQIYRKSGGIPRLINLVCDRALLGAYSQNSKVVDKNNIKQAFKEIGAEERRISLFPLPGWVFMGTAAGAVFGVFLMLLVSLGTKDQTIRIAASAEEQTTKTDNIVATDRQQRINDQEQLDSTIEEVFDPKIRFGQRFVKDLQYTAPPFNSKLSAYESVLSAWGISYSQDNNKLVCEFVETQGLRCLHKQGNWRGLLQINRPVVMRLINNKGQVFFVGLLAVEGDYAKISLGMKTIWTSLDAIDKQWYGDYSVVWRLPPYKSRVIKPGVVSDPDKWLSGNIHKVNKSRLSSTDGGWGAQLGEGASLVEQVQWFQKKVGLTPDGIAGALTLIHLNNFINPGIPMLVKQSASTELPKS